MKKSILNIGKALNRKEQKQIGGGNFIGSDCRTSCPSWNYEGQNVPCGTFIGGFGSQCFSCTTFGGNPGYECRIFMA
jgi:hypothetical protein